jgi:hypothetical protein
MFEVEVCWVVTPCSVVVGYQCFGEPCCLHLHWVVKPSSDVVGYQLFGRPCRLHLQGEVTSQPRILRLAIRILNNFCRILTMVCWYWTNCTFGLYPSSGVSKNWGIKNIDKISQYTRPQNSHKGQLLSTEREAYKLWSSSLCSLLHPPTTSSLLGPNILLSTMFSDTLSLHSPLSVRDEVPHPYKTTGKIMLLYI